MIAEYAGWGIAGAFAAAWFIRERRLSARLRDAAEAVDAMLGGNRNLRIQVPARDRTAPLIFAVNRLAEQYQDHRVEGIRSEQARRRMLSDLSHDVRTPLTSMLGYLDAICEGRAGDEAEEYLTIARGKARDLRGYVEELFAMARLDSGDVQLSMEPLDLYELLRREVIGWMPLLQREGVELEPAIPEAEGWIHGDAHALSRVFNNLMQNALRYGGGRFVGVCARADEQTVSFEVWDKGPGLSKEAMGHIFDRLYKGDSSRNSPGYGLGLAICRELVEKLGGIIAAESTPGVRTALRVTLPRVRDL